MERKERGGFFLCILWYAFLYFPGSFPAWALLVLHFSAGLSLVWFWAALGVWLLTVLIRTLLVIFARYGGEHRIPSPANKNPYSKTVRDPYAEMRDK